MHEKKLIGNTPMINIFYEYLGIKDKVSVKLEYYNLTGSIKDRVAYRILKNAKDNGSLKENMPVVEATSGNTGISLSAIGAFLGHKVHIFMPDWASEERVKIMKNYGANVVLISKEEGGFVRCVEEAKKFADENNGFLANQFANLDNFNVHFEETGKEILEQLYDKEILAFVSGVGTGGTLMGIGKRLKLEFNEMKITAIEPDKMPIISAGKIISQHKIEGIGDDFVPDLVDKKAIDDIILVNDEDAINMSRKIAKELGIGVGISSGANFLGAILISEKLRKSSPTKDGNVVTVFADDNKKYLTTDLAKEIDNNESFISNKIKLLGYEII